MQPLLGSFSWSGLVSVKTFAAGDDVEGAKLALGRKVFAFVSVGGVRW